MESSKAVVINGPEPTSVEKALVQGDLSKLSVEDRLSLYKKTCDSLGLNPLTKPFDYISLNGKLTLYAKKDATDQLRKINRVSINIVSREKIGDVYVVTARAKTPDGREDESTGAVALGKAAGDAFANAMMKAECVPTDYQILTVEGFKAHHEVDLGDLVAAYDIESEKIKWVPLQEKSVFPNQRVAAFSSSTTAFEITPDHKWVTLNSAERVVGLRPFNELRQTDRILLAAVETDTKSHVTEAEAALFGWIMTDGTMKSYRGKAYRASICQSRAEHFDHIESNLRNVFGEAAVSRGVTNNRERGWKDQVWWYLSKEQTQTLFGRIGYESNEDLPRIACQLSFEARQAMLEAMMRADGDARRNFGKGKPEVIELFQILCTLNGIALSQLKTRLFQGSTQPFYAVRQMSYTSVVRMYLEEEGTRETDVWCPTTEYGTWIMRSPEGQIAITGNTKAKRRATLSICGLGWMDETEAETIPDARLVPVEAVHGEIKGEVRAIAPPQPLQFEEAPELPLSVEEQAAEVVDRQVTEKKIDFAPLRPAKPEERDVRPPTDKQIQRLYAIASAVQWSQQNVHEAIAHYFNKTSTTELTRTEYNRLCDQLTQMQLAARRRQHEQNGPHHAQRPE